MFQSLFKTSANVINCAA